MRSDFDPGQRRVFLSKTYMMTPAYMVDLSFILSGSRQCANDCRDLMIACHLVLDGCLHALDRDTCSERYQISRIDFDFISLRITYLDTTSHTSPDLSPT